MVLLAGWHIFDVYKRLHCKTVSVTSIFYKPRYLIIVVVVVLKELVQANSIFPFIDVENVLAFFMAHKKFNLPFYLAPVS
jgi:hypothetical protein